MQTQMKKWTLTDIGIAICMLILFGVAIERHLEVKSIREEMASLPKLTEYREARKGSFSLYFKGGKFWQYFPNENEFDQIHDDSSNFLYWDEHPWDSIPPKKEIDTEEIWKDLQKNSHSS